MTPSHQLSGHDYKFKTSRMVAVLYRTRGRRGNSDPRPPRQRATISDGRRKARRAILVPLSAMRTAAHLLATGFRGRLRNQSDRCPVTRAQQTKLFQAVSVRRESKRARGTTRAAVQRVLRGATDGHTRKMTMLGYECQAQFQPDSRLSFDQHLRLGTAGAAWPGRTRFETRSLAGRTSTSINFSLSVRMKRSTTAMLPRLPIAPKRWRTA